MSDFKWTIKKREAAFTLAQGYSQKEAADTAKVSEKTVYRWLKVPAFSREVDELTLETGAADKAERIKIAKQVIRGRMLKSIPMSNKDLMDWLKYIQDEIEGQEISIVGDPERPITYEIQYTDPGEDTDTLTEAALISANGNNPGD